MLKLIVEASFTDLYLKNTPYEYCAPKATLGNTKYSAPAKPCAPIRKLVFFLAGDPKPTRPSNP